MKKLIIFIALAICVGCGSLEQLYDSENYESITNETGVISIYSGGKKVSKLAGKVLYASADTSAMYIQTATKTLYVQADCLIMEINK